MGSLILAFDARISERSRDSGALLVLPSPEPDGLLQAVLWHGPAYDGSDASVCDADLGNPLEADLGFYVDSASRGLDGMVLPRDRTESLSTPHAGFRIYC